MKNLQELTVERNRLSLEKVDTKVLVDYYSDRLKESSHPDDELRLEKKNKELEMITNKLRIVAEEILRIEI